VHLNGRGVQAIPNRVAIAGIVNLHQSRRSGDTARGLDWLERAYREQNPALISLRVHTELKGLRTHPRVARVLAEMRLPER
jgi:hypothetical protein